MRKIYKGQNHNHNKKSESVWGKSVTPRTAKLIRPRKSHRLCQPSLSFGAFLFLPGIMFFWRWTYSEGAGYPGHLPTFWHTFWAADSEGSRLWTGVEARLWPGDEAGRGASSGVVSAEEVVSAAASVVGVTGVEPSEEARLGEAWGAWGRDGAGKCSLPAWLSTFSKHTESPCLCPSRLQALHNVGLGHFLLMWPLWKQFCSRW